MLIVVGQDQFIIEQHGTQTISLDEIASALSSDFDGDTPPSSCTKKDAAAKSPEVSTASGLFCAHFFKRDKKMPTAVSGKFDGPVPLPTAF